MKSFNLNPACQRSWQQRVILKFKSEFATASLNAQIIYWYNVGVSWPTAPVGMRSNTTDAVVALVQAIGPTLYAGQYTCSRIQMMMQTGSLAIKKIILIIMLGFSRSIELSEETSTSRSQRGNENPEPLAKSKLVWKKYLRKYPDRSLQLLNFLKSFLQRVRGYTLALCSLVLASVILDRKSRFYIDKIKQIQLFFKFNLLHQHITYFYSVGCDQASQMSELNNKFLQVW